jgi:hypothetical protein
MSTFQRDLYDTLFKQSKNVWANHQKDLQKSPEKNVVNEKVGRRKGGEGKEGRREEGGNGRKEVGEKERREAGRREEGDSREE